MPSGLRYERGFLTATDEQAIVAELTRLPLKPFEFHGYLGNRRVVSFGLRYDYARRGVEVAEPPPAFLNELAARVAEFAKRGKQEFRQIGVNEYRPGAGIGWHRDKPEFGDVVGVSLLAPAKMRFRRRQAESWLRASHILEPRSIYILTGEVREQWEHSIPALTQLRYSITFRTLAAGQISK